jgi:predicted enzyme related to lactoylglutathione lyase
MGNSLCHFEILCSDVTKAREFYGRIFDWQFDDAAFPGYVIVRSGAEPTAGIMVKPPATPHHALNVYFRVDCIDTTLQSVVSEGGTVVVAKTEIPKVGHWAMFTDPDGIAVGLLEPLKM